MMMTADHPRGGGGGAHPQHPPQHPPLLSFRDRESALPPSKEISELTFVVKKKSKMKLSGVSILVNRRENLKINVALCSRSRPRI